MPVADDPNGTLTSYYRAVGKTAPGHTRPTHTTDCATLDAAEAAGDELVRKGVWDEYYIKTIRRRAHALRN